MKNEKQFFFCEVRNKGTGAHWGLLVYWTNKTATAKLFRQNGYAVQNVRPITEIESSLDYILCDQKTFDENGNLIDLSEHLKIGLKLETDLINVITSERTHYIFYGDENENVVMMEVEPENGPKQIYFPGEPEFLSLMELAQNVYMEYKLKNDPDFFRPIKTDPIDEKPTEYVLNENSSDDVEKVPPRNENDEMATTTKATIKPMIAELESLFSKLNDRFFDGKLETPVITIAPDTCRAYGWFTEWRAWKETDNKDSDGYFEINITSDYLDRDPVEIAGTLLHEMVHLYNTMNNIQDCSRGGHYHNAKFKDAAESHGLIVTKTPKSGFGQTTPTPETAEYFKSLNLKFDLYRPTPEKGQRPKKKSSTRKYVCPVCGTIIRATKEVHVTCTDCDVEFEEVVE